MLPSCYHIASDNTFTKILSLHDNFEDSLRFVMKQNTADILWFLDERYSSGKILEYADKHPEDVIFLRRHGGQNGYRIDRPNWNYDIRLVKKGYYFDAHCPRPYTEFKDTIDPLVE